MGGSDWFVSVPPRPRVPRRSSSSLKWRIGLRRVSERTQSWRGEIYSVSDTVSCCAEFLGTFLAPGDGTTGEADWSGWRWRAWRMGGAATSLVRSTKKRSYVCVGRLWVWGGLGVDLLMTARPGREVWLGEWRVFTRSRSGMLWYCSFIYHGD